MELALKEAELAKERDEVPVGAVIIDKNNNILASNGNRVIELSDPTAHAEILCIREASWKIKNERLIDCTIFSTLEPCAMCSSAISLSRIKKLFFGAYDHKTGAVESGIKYFQTSSCNHKPEFYGGFKEKDSESILNSYFKMKRV
jgi:tRNA(adenine34) deaminase